MPKAPAAEPTRDPNQPPGNAERLLSLVRGLIAYGRELVSILQNQPSPATVFDINRNFGARDVAQIIARIIRGLRIASALEDRLVRSARRLDRPRARATAATSQLRPPPPAAGLTPPTTTEPVRLPAPRDIAARLRNRPIGAVIVEICNDLGIVASNPLWREIQRAVIHHNGNFSRLVQDMLRRTALTNVVPPDTPMLPWPGAPIPPFTTGARPP